MRHLFEGMGWLFFFIGLIVFIRGCDAPVERPIIGNNGWFIASQKL